MLSKQIDELKMTGCLPSPTGVGMLILQLTQGEDFALGELTRAIQTDPALTGRILKLANSVLRPGAEPARQVTEAIMRLGVRTVRNVALGFTLVQANRSGACREFDYEEYWSVSLARAVAAQAIAAEMRGTVPADAFACGLLAGIGRLALASIHPDRYAEVLVRRREGGSGDLRALEQEAFGIDHGELTAAMMRDWKLPETFAWAAAIFGSPDPAEEPPTQAARQMAELLRAASKLGACPDEAAPAVVEVAHALRLREEVLPGMCRRIQDDWREWGSVLCIPTVSAAAPAATPPVRAGAPGEQVVPASAAFPAAKEPAVPAERPAISADRRGLRILAVDDDPVALRLLVHHLTRDGHTVSQATDGRQALRLALEQQPQMVVTDWMMPELDGLEVCKALRRTSHGAGVYILIVTGREDENRVVEALDAGADEYVTKPFNPRILLARVRVGQRLIGLREKLEQDDIERQRQVARMAVLNRKFESAALTDALTQLPNRRYAMDRLEQELSAFERTGMALSVVMIDIDHFKAVNDRFGHDVGDIVLRETAKVLKNSVRKADVVCRLGGEEFLVISPGSDIDGCTKTAERIRAAVEENVIGYGFDRAVTVSLGVAALDPHRPVVEDLLKSADRRVYAAKGAGRNNVCSRSPEEREKTA